MANERHPDVCLLDVVMPELDGYEVLQAIKHDKRLAKTKVILVSGADSKHEVGMAYALGADDYLVKPVDATLLVQRVRAQLAFGASATSVDG